MKKYHSKIFFLNLFFYWDFCNGKYGIRIFRNFWIFRIFRTIWNENFLTKISGKSRKSRNSVISGFSRLEFLEFRKIRLENINFQKIRQFRKIFQKFQKFRKIFWKFRKIRWKKYFLPDFPEFPENFPDFLDFPEFLEFPDGFRST